MLSYRHSFHAGNFADLIKHTVLVDILEHLTQKEAAFEYIDTHAGTGLYSLNAPEAQKLQEYTTGIGGIEAAQYPEFERYFQTVQNFNDSDELCFYPGSPSIAKHFLRPQDRAWLYELHPQDNKTLNKNMQRNKKVRVYCKDGLDGINAHIPPTSRRGLVLIDPSYEVKSEYDQVAQCVIHCHKRFSTGIYAIWYPVVNRATINKLESKLVNSGIKNIQRFELGLQKDSSERGMTASGMIVINPPWKLFDKMSRTLPRLAQQLGGPDHFYKCDILATE